MKRLILFKSFTLLVLVILLTGCVGSANEDVHEFDFNVQVSSTHSFTANVVEEWAALVDEKTDGQVKINIYTSGALGTLDTAYEDIKGGVYDIGYVIPTLESETELFPLTIGELPFALSSAFDQLAVLTPFHEKYTVDAFDEATLMSISSSDPYEIVSKEPIESIVDLKNKKINGLGGTSIRMITDWGGVPVSLELGQLYEALDKGTIDQAVYPAIGSTGLKLYEVAPYLTKIDATAMTLAYLMNTDALNSLPEDLKKVFVEELNPRLAELAAEVYTNDQKLRLEQFEDEGGQVIILEEAELNKFKEPSEKIWADWVEDANGKGYPGEEMMDYFKELLEKEGVEIPF